MQNKRDMIGSVLLILIGIGVIIWSIRLQVGTIRTPLPGFFPFLVGFMIIVLSLILFVQGWLGRGKAPQAFGNWQRPSIIVAGVAIYTVILEPLGYILSTLFISVVTLRTLGVMSWKVISLGSLVLSVTVYFLFTRVLGVELPAGILIFLAEEGHLRRYFGFC
jgi:putative tricarboxylic transport membrane protein